MCSVVPAVCAISWVHPSVADSQPGHRQTSSLFFGDEYQAILYEKSAEGEHSALLLLRHICLFFQTAMIRAASLRCALTQTPSTAPLVLACARWWSYDLTSARSLPPTVLARSVWRRATPPNSTVRFEVDKKKTTQKAEKTTTAPKIPPGDAIRTWPLWL